MKAHGLRRLAMAALVAGVLIPAAGCQSKYFNDRWNDVKDTMEVGISTSNNGQFGIYAGITHFITLGGTTLDCELHGLANSQWGSHKLYDKSWGVLFVGEDSHVVASGGMSLPPEEEIMKYDCGFLGMPFGEPGDAQTALTCPGMIHLGYGGIVWNWKMVEVIDCILGWTTLDVLKDDTGVRPLAPVGPAGMGTRSPLPGSSEGY